MLYFSLVRSYLEFGVSIWSPYYLVHMESVERIQDTFLRYLSYKADICHMNLSYKDLANYFNINSLQLRRLHVELKTLFKLLNGIIDCHDIVEILENIFSEFRSVEQIIYTFPP